MNRVEQLMASWEAGTLSEPEAAELKQLLAAPEARAQLVDEWLFQETVYHTLKASQAEAAAAVPQPVPARQSPPATKPSRVPRRLFPWLVWREARISLRWSLGFTLAVCLFVFSLNLYFKRSPVGRLGDVQSQVVLDRKGMRLTVQSGQLLYPGDLVKVPAAGTATILWENEPTQISLGPGTEMRLLNPLRGKRLSLRTGNLEANVASQPSWRPMNILTPHAQATVLGTHFSLSSTGTTTRLEVLEGAVALRKTHPTAIDDKNEVTVHAGETAAAAPNMKLAVQFLTGFLSTDSWAVPQGTTFADAPTIGTVVTNSQTLIPADASYRVERLRGYLLAPATGDFTFWIASFNANGPGELWLSTDDDPAHKTRIALATPAGQARTQTPSPAATTGRKASLNSALNADWRRSSSQRSNPQKLIQGRRYYLEVWHAGSGVESLALGWHLPGESQTAPPRMVDIHALCPFIEAAAADQRSAKR